MNTLNLDAIDIDDDGMEDLETFNAKYLNQIIKENHSTNRITKNITGNNKLLLINNEEQIGKFSISNYFKRILASQAFPREKLLLIIKELTILGNHNCKTMSLIKSIKKSTKKEEIIKIINTIIFSILN